MDNLYYFYALLLLVAFLYAAVGHGGASGYLALMAIYGMAPEIMKPTALLLNIFVSAIAFLQFYGAGHFLPRTFLPFAIASVPLAFLGGQIHVDATVYKKVLGCLLLLPIVRFLFVDHATNVGKKKPTMVLSLLIGSAIGFLSGLIGIGGGIILSPVLLLLQWADQKQSAALSAAFIFVNSIAGLAGQVSTGVKFTVDMYLYIMVATIGGLTGAYFGAHKFRQPVLKNLLAVVLILAAYKLLFSKA